ncbi:DEAD/DEAH box helicase [Cytophagaceae bacterium ABcell3]|nr:DEAD/DEAH box helicase [Cytophagaceae bacterium ABcell3]
MTFHELGISQEVLKAIDDAGYTTATPIQAKSIPAILQGGDILGQAQTGTGKTAAFTIPAIENIDPDIKGLQVMVMCPTRELALQVAGEAQKLSKYRKVKVLSVYGGESIDFQIRSLQRGAQMVVGTPGRIIDHLNRRTLDLSNLKMIILDEADEMLNMGFREDIETILDHMPAKRQTLLFSATMPDAIMAITHKYQKNPSLIKITRGQLTVSTIEQIYFDIRSSVKMEIMTRLIELYDFKLMLVFCNQKTKVDEVTEELKSKGFSAEGLHGDMRQGQRTITMNMFRKGDINILVATDVAARGIDVEGVDAVFNFDLPQDVEYYVHRIGRTGRAGKTGKAFSFITGRKEADRLRSIERHTKVKLQKGTIPGREELEAVRHKKVITLVGKQKSSGELDSYYKLIEKFTAEGFSLEDLAAAFLLKHFPPESETEEITQFSSDKGGSRSKEKRGKNGRRRSGNVGMTRLFLNVGTKDRVRPGDIVGALAGETKIAGRDIGVIEIFDKFSFVEVPKKDADGVLRGMGGAKIKGKTVNIEVAK